MEDLWPRLQHALRRNTDGHLSVKENSAAASSAAGYQTLKNKAALRYRQTWSHTGSSLLGFVMLCKCAEIEEGEEELFGMSEEDMLNALTEAESNGNSSSSSSNGGGWGWGRGLSGSKDADSDVVRRSWGVGWGADKMDRALAVTYAGDVCGHGNGVTLLTPRGYTKRPCKPRAIMSYHQGIMHVLVGSMGLLGRVKCRRFWRHLSVQVYSNGNGKSGGTFERFGIRLSGGPSFEAGGGQGQHEQMGFR